MDTLKEIFDLLHTLYGLPGYVLVYLSCIAFGYLAKAVKFVPNDKIPLLIFLWGTVWNLLLADAKAPDASLRLWVARNLMIGFLIAGVAWWTHARYLKKWIDARWFPANVTLDSNEVGKP